MPNRLEDAETEDRRVGWLFVSPAFIALILIAALPFLFALATSFASFDLRTGRWDWVGFKNYANMLGQSRLWNAVWVTLHISVIALILEFAIGFGLALALREKIQLKKIFIVLLILPAAVAPIAVAEIWKLIFNADFGPLNYILGEVFGMDPVVWLNDPTLSIYAIVIAEVWQWTPFVMLMLYSGMLGIPREILEASSMDGATYFEQVRFVILPALKPIIIVTLIIRSVDMLKLFELPFIMTQGGPGSATETLSMYIYQLGFKFWKLPDAAVATFVVMVIAIALVSVYARSILKGDQS
ncbi:carbohydrate ABC transporter permease [Palleronia caenipelagi]|uniref:Sugar ABC transporter permease n=1 Tax=Palleronia caenipelagi TaxID=2489174 RepID=A0A547PLN6_9RHOB|nr:sugar ABC transporter permease [Palleronia caenipelagi]TRD15033.1 sugar ABC transporter permease [Palleronia caenipelagi]